MTRPEIVIIETPELGDRSYIVATGTTAVVVDPQRDIDRVLAVLTERGWQASHVIETHVHNDYVSGGLALSAQVGATYVVPKGHDYAFDALTVGDGDWFSSDAMTWRVLHTPGHTPHHVSYALSIEGTDRAVFTGGSLLFGSVGRPDLIGPDATEGLAHDQWHSVRKLVTDVDDSAGVFPTHGFGSFCSATATVGVESTIATQAATNPAALLDEHEFVAEMLAGLDTFPAYYKHMGPANEQGARPIDLTPAEHADPEELRRRIQAGEWVVDLRQRRLWAAEHLAGSLSFDVEGNAITYLGWLIPWGTPVTLARGDPGADHRVPAQPRAHRHRPARCSERRRTPHLGIPALGAGHRATGRLPGAGHRPGRGPGADPRRRPTPHRMAGGTHPGGAPPAPA